MCRVRVKVLFFGWMYMYGLLAPYLVWHSCQDSVKGALSVSGDDNDPVPYHIRITHFALRYRSVCCALPLCQHKSSAVVPTILITKTPPVGKQHTLVFVPMPRSVSTRQCPSASRMAASTGGEIPEMASTLRDAWGRVGGTCLSQGRTLEQRQRAGCGCCGRVMECVRYVACSSRMV